MLDKSLIESARPYSPDQDIDDIHESSAWKKFKAPDVCQFTAKCGNMIFAMFVDGINPEGKKQTGRKVSITFVVLVCLALLFEMRYLVENIFIVGIAPGPNEPALEQMN